MLAGRPVLLAQARVAERLSPLRVPLQTQWSADLLLRHGGPATSSVVHELIPSPKYGLGADTRLTSAGLAVAAAVLAAIAGGCGGAAQEVKTVTVEHQVTVDAPPVHQRKKRQAATKPVPSDEFVNCDPNIQAKVGTTTCPFAENAFWAYWTSGQSSSPLPVWSPAAHATFTATCESDAAEVVCTTGDNGVVKFSQTAVDRYSQVQAEAYGSTHDLGPDPYEGLPPTTPVPPDAGGSGDDCQGYDPCLPPGDDVDCGGGSGNGPRYVDGQVYVNGSDPYGLDSNYDGVGCEY
jgi:hypothetical protein